MNQNTLFSIRYNADRIYQKNKEISQKILKESSTINNRNYSKITLSDLKLLFSYYDAIYFNDFFIPDYSKRISFQLSTRMTKAAGKTYHHLRTKNITISLSLPLLFQTFQEIQRTIIINGMPCHNRLEATMRIFEHELIHMIEFLFFEKSSCNKPRFKQLAHNIFGHTDVTHQLITQREIAEKKYDLHIGNKVAFTYDEKTYQGIISRITKRATVMVADPTGFYQDINGKRYTKFYVPLEDLNKR